MASPSALNSGVGFEPGQSTARKGVGWDATFHEPEARGCREPLTMDRSYRFERRPAQRARDLTRLIEIERACFPEKLAYLRSELYRFLRAPNATCKVAEDRETREGVGFVIVSWRKGCKVGYVQTIDVDPKARGNGLGRLLLETAERVMAERGLSKSILQVYLRNNSALGLYLKEGYTIRRVRTRYYANSFRGARDALEMVKELEPLAPTALTATPGAPSLAGGGESALHTTGIPLDFARGVLGAAPPIAGGQVGTLGPLARDAPWGGAPFRRSGRGGGF